MVVGFNHNFRYKGEVYHVQTEDGGQKCPNIVTLLYKGGNILASKKTSYADICKVDKLDQVVEDLSRQTQTLEDEVGAFKIDIATHDQAQLDNQAGKTVTLIRQKAESCPLPSEKLDIAVGTRQTPTDKKKDRAF